MLKRAHILRAPFPHARGSFAPPLRGSLVCNGWAHAVQRQAGDFLFIHTVCFFVSALCASLVPHSLLIWMRAAFFASPPMRACGNCVSASSACAVGCTRAVRRQAGDFLSGLCRRVSGCLPFSCVFLFVCLRRSVCTGYVHPPRRGMRVRFRRLAFCKIR